MTDLFMKCCKKAKPARTGRLCTCYQPLFVEPAINSFQPTVNMLLNRQMKVNLSFQKLFVPTFDQSKEILVGDFSDSLT